MNGVSHAMELAQVCMRLRQHANRALHEKGYKADTSLRIHAQTLRSLAKKIEHRQRLNLSTRWWLNKAQAQLSLYDRENPMR